MGIASFEIETDLEGSSLRLQGGYVRQDHGSRSDRHFAFGTLTRKKGLGRDPQ